MSVLIKHMAMPKGCIYANDKDQTEYCPLLNHDDVPFCQYIENEPEIAIGIDERPVYCPLSDVPEPCEDAISRQAVKEWLAKWEGYIDADIIARMQYRIIDIPSAQSEPSMEECACCVLSKPQQMWIPCSERLPKRGKDVLVTRDYDGREDYNKSCRYVEVASCYGEDDDITWNSFSDEYKMNPRNHHVVAWMPLPEPYRAERRTYE